MPKDKERSINPAQAQRKLEKQKALKKGKAEALARRNEKLARRNPERIQRQINDLKAIEESGSQVLRPREKQILEELERDLRAVLKAREALGDKAPQFPSPAHRGQRRDDSRGVLGKRRRGEDDLEEEEEDDDDDDGSDTDESVRNIPMPRDTPPPIPPQYRRRGGPWPSREAKGGEQQHRQLHALPAKPEAAPAPRTVYESAPVIRDLRQEAVSKFVPAAVRRQQDAIRGQGRLVEPEEMDRLEQAGYLQTRSTSQEQQQQIQPQPGGEEDPEDILKRIEEETRAMPQHNVDIEEVTDEEL